MRRRLVMALAAVASFASLATGAQAQDKLTRDIRCLLILSASPLVKDQPQAAMMTMGYLFGRIDAESGDGDWTDMVTRQAVAMEGVDLTAEAKTCGAFLEVKGKNMVERGKRMVEAGESMSRKKP